MPSGKQAGSAVEVLSAFGRLGLTSFGGPVAHIGYFREAFVVRRKWLDETSFADLVALAQFLPGPASSQVAFSLGLIRAGWRGAFSASLAFTLPSFLVMLAFGLAAQGIGGPFGLALEHGLKLVAVAIVAQAVWGMAINLCPDPVRAGIALTAMAIVTATAGPSAQLMAILAGGFAGGMLCSGDSAGVKGELPPIPISRSVGLFFIADFFVLLVVPYFLLDSAVRNQMMAFFSAFYRSGALVFGGGHVVLPLLREAVVVPGWVSNDVFLAGYGAAQVLPGPLFTFAAYLGAASQPMPSGVEGAIMSTVAIFMPGLLLMAGVLPFWDTLRRRPGAQAAMRGTNAAVVGILASALYNPVWTSAVLSPVDFASAAIGFVMLTAWKMPPLAVVAIVAPLGAMSSLVYAHIYGG
jgi:chromate transporter